MMKELLTRHWHFMRIARVVLGVAGIIFAIREQLIGFGILSALLLLMGLLNAGCGAGRCGYQPNQKK